MSRRYLLGPPYCAGSVWQSVGPSRGFDAPTGASRIFSVPVILCRTMLLSSGAVTEIVRVTVFIALQTVVLAAIGASHGLMALGLSMIVVAVVRTILWLRATSAHLGVPMLGILRTFRLSAAVAVVSAIGPIVALVVFGPYPSP